MAQLLRRLHGRSRHAPVQDRPEQRWLRAVRGLRARLQHAAARKHQQPESPPDAKREPQPDPEPAGAAAGQRTAEYRQRYGLAVQQSNE